MSDLKPCPFCGGPAHKYTIVSPFAGGATYHEIACFDCCASTDKCLTSAGAEERWNRRIESCTKEDGIMKNKKNSTGLSLLDLLAVAFIVLKLTHVIDWSWWWVLAPIWGVVLFAALVGILDSIKIKKGRQR